MSNELIYTSAPTRGVTGKKGSSSHQQRSWERLLPAFKAKTTPRKGWSVFPSAIADDRALGFGAFLLPTILSAEGHSKENGEQSNKKKRHHQTSSLNSSPSRFVELTPARRPRRPRTGVRSLQRQGRHHSSGA